MLISFLECAETEEIRMAIIAENETIFQGFKPRTSEVWVGLVLTALSTVLKS